MRAALAFIVRQCFSCGFPRKTDYIHLTKAFGTLAASNLPLHFFLSGKSRSFLHRHLIHYSHDQVNVLHRWLGRLIFTFITFHAILYLNYFWVTGQLSSVLDWDIMFGVAGFFMLVGPIAGFFCFLFFFQKKRAQN